MMGLTQTTPKKIIAAKLRYLAGLSLGVLAKLMYKTLSSQLVITQEHYQNPQQQVIYGMWHNRILVSVVTYIEYMQSIKANKSLYVLTSASKDGELIAGMMKVVGIKTIRGSSHKKAKAAGLEIYRTLKTGKDICITPDGPKGPIYQLKPGLIQIAAKTQVPILPIKVEYADYWELPTWDKFKIPKPFSKVKVTYGELQWVPSDYDEPVETQKLTQSLSD